MTNDEVEDAFWNDGDGLCVVREEPMPAPRPVYDLEERTTRFGEAVIDFANTISRTAVTHRLIGQLVVGCGTSAKYRMKPIPSSLVIRRSSFS